MNLGIIYTCNCRKFHTTTIVGAQALTLSEAVNNAEILTRAQDDVKRFKEHEEMSKSIAVVGTEKEKENGDAD